MMAIQLPVEEYPAGMGGGYEEDDKLSDTLVGLRLVTLITQNRNRKKKNKQTGRVLEA